MCDQNVKEKECHVLLHCTKYGKKRQHFCISLNGRFNTDLNYGDYGTKLIMLMSELKLCCDDLS